MSDSGTRVKGPARSARSEGILRALERLGDELGARPPGEQAAPLEWSPARLEREEDERLLTGLREELARLADPLGRGPADAEHVVWSIIDGAQQMARNEILTNSWDELRRMLPAIAYLVRLSIAGEAEAKLVAGRAEELLREETRAAL